MALGRLSRQVNTKYPCPFRDGIPLELLYADDLVFLADTEELLVEKIVRWKAGLEEKRMEG